MRVLVGRPLVVALLTAVLLFEPISVTNAATSFDSATRTLTTDQFKLVLSSKGQIEQLDDLPNMTSLLDVAGSISCLWDVVFDDNTSIGGCSSDVALVTPIETSW